MERLSTISGQHFKLFNERLQRSPRCTDDYSFGTVIRCKATAIKHRYIQPNTPRMVHQLVFDVDRPDGVEAWYTANLPPPSLIIQNIANGHCHYIYQLSTPVSKSAASRRKPIQWLAALENGMIERIGADIAYSGQLCKTPNHSAWRTLEPCHAAIYDLHELAECVDTSPANIAKINKKRKGIRVGLGRNIELFDTARYWAYEWVADYRAAKTIDQWHAAALHQCESLNTFATPLPACEVRAIARSIARWTWNKYTGRLSNEEFSKRQSARGKKGKGKSGRKAKKTLAQFQEADDGGN
jgi:hypothetical protein